METTSAGTVTRTFGHLPFGQTWYETGTPDKWKFTGYERDTSESGLDYAMNRMYSSGYGRFETPDLLAGEPGNPESINRHAYVSGDPANLSDIFGLAGGISQRPIYDVYNPGRFETGWTSLAILELAFTPTALLGYVQTDEAGNVLDLGIAPYYGNWGALALLGLPPQDTGPPDPTAPPKPLFCNAKVQNQSDTAFMKTQNGSAGAGLAEAGFSIEFANGKISFGPMIDSVHSDPPYNQLNIPVDSNSIAIFHTHGNRGVPTPSAGDLQSKLPNFVRSQFALYVTVPGTTNYVQLNSSVCKAN